MKASLRRMSMPERWETIRREYEKRMPAILRGEEDPCFLDWVSIFTPIEMAIWQDIRAYGLNFWPQFPIGGFFVDFADPKRRIAIECDGAAFHDEAKDRARDRVLMEKGWRVVRVTGRDCLSAVGTNIVRRLAGYTDDERPEVVCWDGCEDDQP